MILSSRPPQRGAELRRSSHYQAGVPECVGGEGVCGDGGEVIVEFVESI